MESLILTNEILNEIQTPNGAYTKKQLEILEISWPPIKGWKNRIIGKKITS